MKRFAVYVTYEVGGYVTVEAEDEFEARCLVLDMDGAEIEGVANWGDMDSYEISDAVYEVR